MTRRFPLLPAALLAGLLLAGPGPAAAQDPPKGGGLDLDGELPEPLTEKERKEALELFEKAKQALEKDAFQAARARFQEFLRKYPGADPDLIQEAEDRGGENCLVGVELQHEGGPPERRIDVELMGDGYIAAKMHSFRKDAVNQMKEFWREPLYDEYETYFNVWRFDLISKEDGVDELSMEERMGGPPPDPEPSRPGRRRKGPKKFSTALNCVAAGPQNQVWADPEQVMRWRKYFKHSDGLTIAFAKKGQLGMGGMGIATTGKRVAVVHEFGHAFVGLLDEYTGNPNPPMGGFFRHAPNAVLADESDPRKEPPLETVPWKHWLDARADGVGMFLGGATYSVGVFRPAASCAMNSGGSSAYCRVCREAGVLRIYSYLSPIDEAGPTADRVTLLAGEEKEFFVQPMQPKRHRLEVTWFLQREEGPVAEEATAADDPAPPDYGGSFVRDERAAQMWKGDGDRGFARRQNPLPEGPPGGEPLKSDEKRVAGGFRSRPVLPDLAPGRYRLTARVVDDTKIRGDRFPWVLKDPDRLLEERRTWILEVVAPAAEEPAPAK